MKGPFEKPIMPLFDYVIVDDARLPETLSDYDGMLPYDSPELRAKIDSFLVDARRVARPMGVYAAMTPKPLSESKVLVKGKVFESELLVKNIGNLKTIHAFLASEGRELAAWSGSLSPEDQKIAFAIRFMTLKETEDLLETRIMGETGLSGLAAMAPGAIPEWPLPQQKVFMELMADAASRMGLALDPETLWLSPMASSTGFFFENHDGFHNCYYCIAECPWRRYPLRSKT
jgi:hypothetical protein